VTPAPEPSCRKRTRGEEMGGDSGRAEDVRRSPRLKLVAGDIERASSSKMYFWVFVVNTQVSNLLSQSNFHYRWKSEDCLLLAFLRRRLRVSCPETPVYTRRILWSGSGDSGLSLRGRFSSGVARPRYGGGDSGRKLWQKLVSGPETPALATNPEDSGLWTPETPA
jgi:hypothetical protein